MSDDELVKLTEVGTESEAAVLCGCLDDLLAAVPDVRVPEPRSRVEVAAALGVPEV